MENETPGPVEAAAGITGRRYSSVAIVLHWTIAALVLANLYLGLFHESYAKPVAATLLRYHKAIGFTVLALTLVRLGWRLAHRPPAFDPVLKRWEAGLAASVHWLFYFVLVAVPATGWLLTSTGGRASSYFGLFTIPPLPVGHGDDAHDAFGALHQYLAYFMILLIVLHVAGALKHQFEGHRQILGRMAPFLYRTR
jgi:cytochrome b561